MPARLMVFCTRSVRGVSRDDVLAAMSEVDFYTVAEGFGIEDENLVDQALSLLHIEPFGQAGFVLHYRAPGIRQINIDISTDRNSVAEECAEATARLAAVTGDGAKQALLHLDQTIEIVNLELGASQFTDMGIVLAGQGRRILRVRWIRLRAGSK
jgi:hypothetical protein